MVTNILCSVRSKMFIALRTTKDLALRQVRNVMSLLTERKEFWLIPAISILLLAEQSSSKKGSQLGCEG